MEVTGWTYWNNEKYFNPDLEYKKLFSENKLTISKIIIHFVNLFKILKSGGRYIPDSFNSKATEYLIDLKKNMRDAVIEYCIENKIFIADFAHQKLRCVPVIDNKFVFQASLKNWAKLMSVVWSKINNKKYDIDYFYEKDFTDNIDGTPFKRIV